MFDIMNDHAPADHIGDLERQLGSFSKVSNRSARLNRHIEKVLNRIKTDKNEQADH